MPPRIGRHNNWIRGTLFLVAVAGLLALIFVSCKKDRFEEPDANQSILPISVEEVKQILGDPSSGLVGSRSPIRVPLHFTPNWDNAILNTQTGTPLVVADVDTCCLPSHIPANGNLIFKKNIAGTIECSLMLWFKSPGSTYDDWRAPLWTQNTFSGLVVLVDERDTIRRVASYVNGSIHKVLVWNKNIRDIAEDELGTSPKVEDRDPKCSKWGRSIWDKIGDSLLEVLDDIGSFFSNLGSNSGNNTGQPNPYSFFFDFLNPPNTWTWVGGGGGAQTEFESYRVDCGIALQNFIANGFYLPEYAHLDMRLCELLSELYVFDNSQSANFRLQCLYTNHQSAYFEEIWQYWENSSKDQNARNVLNNFLDAACGENPSVQKAGMLRHAYCLGNMNLVDLWNRLTTQCGQNFGLEISPCLAEFIFEALEEGETENEEICDEIISLFSEWYYPSPPAVRLTMPDDLNNCFIPGTQCQNCTYSVQLFIEQPVPGTREIHTPWGLDNPGTYKNGGHVFISLNQYDPSYSLLFPRKVKTFGWYPANKPSGNQETPGFFYEENTNSIYNISINFAINLEQFNTIISTISNNYIMYQVERNNCGSVMANALSEAGIYIPETTQHQFPIGDIKCSPGDLGEDIKLAYPSQVFYSNTNTLLHLFQNVIKYEKNICLDRSIVVLSIQPNLPKRVLSTQLSLQVLCR